MQCVNALRVVYDLSTCYIQDISRPRMTMPDATVVGGNMGETPPETSYQHYLCVPRSPWHPRALPYNRNRSQGFPQDVTLNNILIFSHNIAQRGRVRHSRISNNIFCVIHSSFLLTVVSFFFPNQWKQTIGEIISGAALPAQHRASPLRQILNGGERE